ncbi:hypothetical protein VTK26DRAFT_8006 [Humicola hyalothermophila]
MSSSRELADAVQSAAKGPATVPSSSKKKGNKKKKNSSNKSSVNPNSTALPAQEPPAPSADGSGTPRENDGAEGASAEEVSKDLEAPTSNTANPPPQRETEPDRPGPGPGGLDAKDATIEIEPAVVGAADDDDHDHDQDDEQELQPAAANGHAGANGHSKTRTTSEGATKTTSNAQVAETMTQDGGEEAALRLEVEQLRQQLESLQRAHADEVAQLRADLEESEAAKEHAETQYETLLGRVEKIKESLGDRLKRDKAELEEAKDRVDELEAQNDELQRTVAKRDDEIARLKSEVQEQGRELAGLRSRSNLSQQNWLKEKEDITRQMQHLRSELESTTAAMGEWEVIAMEERSLRESLADKTGDLEEQITNLRESFERASSERDTQSQAVDRLQRALQELQETRKRELREMVETSEEQAQALKKQAQEADARAAEAEAAKEALSKELERTAPFEKEVKEKNLLIGKLRHEAIVLNDHLTKALKYIKKTKPEETIDKQLVSNHFLQFLSLDRSDPKKFQILQVMAGLLSWDDSQREKAGLARPGASATPGGASNNSSGTNSNHNTLRLPTSPFHRTPSSPALNTEFFSSSSSSSFFAGEKASLSPSTAGGGAGKESLADLWASFLEQSVDEAREGGGSSSRKDSLASSVGTAATGKGGG